MKFFKHGKSIFLGGVSLTYAFVFFVMLAVIFIAPVSAEIDLDASESKLRAELKKIEAEQAEVQKTLNIQKSKTATIQGDINVLSNQIYGAELDIRKKNIEISRLKDIISLKQNTVEELDNKMEKSKSILAELIRRSNEMDSVSVPEIVLSTKNLTDFFVDIDSVATLGQQLEELFYQIQDLRGETEIEKEQLKTQQSKEFDIKKEIESKKNVIASKKNEKDVLLSYSKQSEATYAAVLAKKRQQASAIRTALFQLRDSGGIPFGEALDYAQKASRQTGVRAAFILGILKQETNIGKIDGSCLIVDLESGKTKSINYGTIFSNGIHPTRDLPLVQNILGNLGRNPLETKVSCPLDGVSGYGGAIGPSQFIPSTWNMFIPSLRKIFGVYPNPWNPEHAIMGTALLLRDNGAVAGGYTAERNAACRYYSGVPCQEGRGNIFYGKSVLNHAASIQKQIDFLDDVD